MNNMKMLIVAALVFSPVVAFGHCDGMDGPVVAAAQRALAGGDVNGVLIWVQKPDEADIRQAFEKTLQVRKLGPQAKDLADRYFFETLVRIHRAGEGAPYTGLKPAGRDLGPAIPAADKALEMGSAEPLEKLLTGSVREGIHGHFHRARSSMRFKKSDVAAGREFVKAYVEFVHYVERVHQASSRSAHGHAPEPPSRRRR